MTHKLLEEIRRDFKKDGELLTSVNGLYAIEWLLKNPKYKTSV